MAASWQRKIGTGEHWTEAEGVAAISAWKASGEPLASFARRHGANPQRLAWWRDRVGTEAQSALVPVTIGRAILTDAVTVSIGDVRVEVADLSQVSPTWIAAVVASLREVGS